MEGVWRLVEEIDRRPDGSLIKNGPAAGYNGLLIFTRSGYMSSTIMPMGRTWKRETVTPTELRNTFEEASAHAGRYQCDTATHRSFRGHGRITARNSRSQSDWRGCSDEDAFPAPRSMVRAP